MGLIRSGAVIFFSSLLFLSIFLGNAFLTVSWSLEYETLEPNLNNFATELIEDMKINKTLSENYNLMLINCQNEELFNLSEQGLNLEIPCQIIKQGPEKVLEYGVQKSIKNIYYKDYNCEYWDCIKNTDTVFVLISETARDYWKSKFYLTLISSIILFTLLVIFIESKKSALTITGALMIVSSIPFRKIDWLFTLLPEGKLTEIFSLFFTRSYNVFLTMLIIGSIILLVGLAFEFFNIGFKITKIFRWIFEKKEDKKGEIPPTENESEKNEEDDLTKEEIKKIVKKEIKKQKKKDIKDTVEKELNNSDK